MMPESTPVYRISGEVARMYEIDAKHAARTFPDEWSLSPWSQEAMQKWAADKAAAERKQ